MKPLPKELKEKLEAQKIGMEISKRIKEANTPKKRVIPTKAPMYLPEDFTGKDMKHFKTLMKPTKT